MTPKTRNILLRSALTIVLAPIVCTVLAAVALYLPPVQNWAVHTASKYASETTGMKISIDEVRLSFPLNLSLNKVRCLKQNTQLPQKLDTIADIEKAVVDVKLLPLLDNEVKVNALEVNNAVFNTDDFIAETVVKGHVGRLILTNDSHDTSDSPVAGVNLNHTNASIKDVIIDNANVDIAMTDSTSDEDTTKTPTPWVIAVKGLKLNQSSVTFHMPGDTMSVRADIGSCKATRGFFNLRTADYTLQNATLENSAVRYDQNYQPHSATLPDLNHIALSDLNLSIDSISYNKAKGTSLALRSGSVREKSGFAINSLKGNVLLDSAHVKANVQMATPTSHISLNTDTQFSAFSTENADARSDKEDANSNKDSAPGTFWLDVDAAISHEDLTRYAFPMAQLPQTLLNAWPRQTLTIKGSATGNLSHLDLHNLKAELPTAFAIDAHGETSGFMDLASNPFSPNFKAHINTVLNTYNLNFVKAMLPAATASSFNIPYVNAKADINAHGAQYDATFDVNESLGNNTPKGHARGNASVNAATMTYDTSLKAENINVKHFVPTLDADGFTGQLTASGQGTNVYSHATTMQAQAEISQFRYGAYDLNNVKATANLLNGHAYTDIDARNSLINGTIKLDALMQRDLSDMTITADLGKMDLQRLQLTQNPLTVSLCGHMDVATDTKEYYKAQGFVSDITLRDSANTYRPNDISLDALTRKDTTALRLSCGDFKTNLHARGGYRWLLGCTDRMIGVLARHFASRSIDQAAMRDAFPYMSLQLHSGKENPFYRLAKFYGLDFNYIDANINTSREDGINGTLELNGLATQGYQFDTLTAQIESRNDPMEIRYKAHMQNSKSNDYVFDAYLDGEVLEHGISINTKLYDNGNKLAMQLGAIATMVEQGINIQLTPHKPVLGYETFTLNDSNYILLGHHGHVSANVDLIADNGTGIKIYSADNDKIDLAYTNDEASPADAQENASGEQAPLQDITLSINHLNIGKIVSVLPYAPKMQGFLDGDFHVIQAADESLTLSSDVTVNNMVYEGCHIGNLGSQITYIPKTDGSHYVNGILLLDDKEISTIEGSYNFNTSAIDANMTLMKFPMAIANGFIPDQILGLEGTADGTLTVQGTTRAPMVNGEVFLENASIISVPYGVNMKFDDDPVRIQNSKLLFENFQVYGYNNQPLVARGFLDFSDTEHINLDLRMKAENFLLIDAKENHRSEAYGKLYVNFYALMRGELSKLQVLGKMDVLPSTNLYYVLRDSPLSTDNRMRDLVTFTDFSAEDPINIVRPTVEGMNVNFTVSVKEGAEVTCWLNSNHSNYLNAIGEGDLRFGIHGEETTLTGRYTISYGEMKYTLPIVPLKTFTISDGSYLEFTGNMMNPGLNITAVEEKRATCDVSGVQQIVTFKTGVKLSKTLNDMGIEFIISAPENQTITEQLAKCSIEERGKLAVTMLTTGMYLQDGNTSSFSMNSALNSFLQSEINQIAGNALKTVDMSFGMDNSTDENGNIHTDYTFKFAKRFWNNRLAISVGGKVSTGPDVSGQNKSFFDNVDLQYRLSDASSRYLQLFYKRSVYDFLEGYVGQYGAGYMWKKKLQTLGEMFHATKQPAAPSDTTKHQATPADTTKTK